jgi:hypothetical protein
LRANYYLFSEASLLVVEESCAKLFPLIICATVLFVSIGGGGLKGLG